MSNTDQLAAVEYEAETNWGENVAMTPTHRIPVAGPIDVSGLTQDSQDSMRQVMQLQGGTLPILGVKGGSFKMKLWLTGHGSATSGATALSAMETFKAYAWGNPSLAESGAKVSAASGTTAAGGSTTTNVVTVASATIARGSLVRLGQGGLSADPRGAGQFYAVNNHTLTNLVLRHATLTALNAADVVHSAVNFWLPELAANTGIKGLRFRFSTPDQRYICRGCFPKSFSLTGLNPGEIPAIEIEWGVSSWDTTTTGAWPSATATTELNPAPVQAGSMIIGDIGSTVRTAYNIRAFSLNVALGVVPLPGHNGVDPFQLYVAAVRTPSKIRASFTIDAEASGTNTFEAKYLAGTSQWFTWTGSCQPGSALGAHAQNFKMDKRPKQVSVNGINSFIIEGYCCAGTDLTNDMSQAALVVAEA